MNKRISVKIIAGLILFLCMLYPLLMLSCSRTTHFELSRFVPPEICGGCHTEIYEQWKNSMHNLSHSDILYRKAAFHFLEGLTDPDEIKEAEFCVKCHTPVGFFTGFPKTVSQERDNPEKLSEIAMQGIQCDFCHSATGAYKLYNNQIKLDPGHGEADPGTKRGPRRDAESDYHKSAYSRFHTSSEICGVCHDVRHVVFGTKLETTYEEWFNSPYNSKDPSKRIPCQGCHMYQRPGMPATGSTERPDNPGVSAMGGVEREHVFTHYFVGGNTVIPGMHGDTVKVKMAEERLKNAAGLVIDDTGIKEGRIGVIVKNTGAGHYLPTGLTDVRQMWLEVTVKNSSGKVILSSGKANADGYLNESTILYNTVFGDGKGNPVDNIAKAREVLRDRRVPPMGSLTESFAIPGGASGSLTVSVRLLYRSAPQELVDMLMGKGKLRLPVVTMAETSKNISLPGGR